MLAVSPPAVESNAALTIWLCERHNEVNKRLLKPLFKCEKAELEKIWGGCGCSEVSDASAGASAASAMSQYTAVAPNSLDGDEVKALRGSR